MTDNRLPLISVIIPVYNVEEYLVQCLQSVLAQTYPHFQVILVDDGSTDESGGICDRYGTIDKRIRVIHKENGGLSDARNAGLGIAEGAYIAFVDSDDFLHREYLKTLYDNMVAEDADLSICGYYCYDGGMPVENSSDEIYNREVVEGSMVTAQLYENPGMAIVAWNKLYSREIFGDIRYPVGRLHEDEAVIHELLVRCRRVVLTNARLYYYRRRSGSIMDKESDKSIEDAVFAYEKRIAFFGSLGMRTDKAQAQRNLLLYLAGRFDGAREDKRRQDYTRMTLRKSMRNDSAYRDVLDKASIVELYIIGYMPGAVGVYRALVKWLVRMKKRWIS